MGGGRTTYKMCLYSSAIKYVLYINAYTFVILEKEKYAK